MINKLNYRQRNKLLLPLTAFGLLLCWFFAFSKTFDAICLHHSFEQEAAGLAQNDLSFNPVHAQKKLNALNEIIKAYRVNPEQWHNDIWLKVSAVAGARNVSIDYTLTQPPIERDSTAVGVNQSLHFYGGYAELVKLMDTLERMPGIGKVSAVQMKAPLKDLLSERKDKCVLKVDFKGIEREK